MTILNVFVWVVLISVLLCLWPWPVAFLVQQVIPRVYTPPALSEKRLRVYSQWVKMCRNNELPDCFVYPWYKITMKDGRVFWRTLPATWDEGEKDLGTNVLNRIVKLMPALEDVNCWRVEVDGDYLLFYTISNMLLPDAPGILYSLDGEDPNDNKELVKRFHHFQEIGGNWYMSRHLIKRRSRKKMPVPKSLLDFSLHRPKGVEQTPIIRKME